MPDAPNIFLTNFASKGFYGKQRLLCASATSLKVVGTALPVRQPELLATDFGIANRDLLLQPRGAGYWAWKPRIILDAMSHGVPGDWILYMDVGRWPRILSRKLDPLFEWCESHDQDFLPGTRVRDLGSSLAWTKRHCAAHFGYGPAELESFQQVNASWSLWKHSERSRDFLTAWSELLTQPHLVDDSPSPEPEWPGFIEHRHDQSVLTCLLKREGHRALFDEGEAELDHRECKDLDLVLSFLGSPPSGGTACRSAFKLIQGGFRAEPWSRSQLSSIRRRQISARKS